MLSGLRNPSDLGPVSGSSGLGFDLLARTALDQPSSCKPVVSSAPVCNPCPAAAPSALDSGPENMFTYFPSFVYRHMWLWVPLAEAGRNLLVAAQWDFMGF